MCNLANVVLLQKLVFGASDTISLHERLRHPLARVNVVHGSWRTQVWNIKHVEGNAAVRAAVEAIKMGHDTVNFQGVLDVLEGVCLRHKVVLAFDGGKEHFFSKLSRLFDVNENPFRSVFSFHRWPDEDEEVIELFLVGAIKRVFGEVLTQVHVVLTGSTAGYMHYSVF